MSTTQYLRVPLTACPTKSAEIAHFEAFVRDLPRNSYLESIFAGSVDAVAGQIRSDLAFSETVPSLIARQREEADRLDDLRQQCKEASEALRKLGFAVGQAEQRLVRIKQAAHGIQTEASVLHTTACMALNQGRQS